MTISARDIEAVLIRAKAGHATPYRWLSRTVSSSAKIVLDLACGTGAMSHELHRPDRIVIGVDWSAEALKLASHRSSGSWIQADARKLPIADESVDAVVSSMGLAVVEPAKELLAEASRVLKPGGAFAALIPTIGPVNLSELALASRLSFSLRSIIRFPGTIMVGFKRMFAEVGLTLVEDQRERYRYHVRSHSDAEQLINALGHKNITQARIEDAIELLGKQAKAIGEVQVAIPMRRIVAIK